jgi:hypothetical protein
MAGKRLILYSLVYCLSVLSACKKEDTIATSDYKTLGTSAHDLLSASRYTSLKIEIQYMPGYAMDTASVSNLTNFLNTYINKPAGIQVSQQQINASGKSVLALNDIVSVEKKYRTIFTLSDVIAVHILITDGYYSSPEILATSYWNTSTCIFGQAIYDNSGGSGQVTRTWLMSTILEHEMGHLLGLVDQGSPMQTNHRDAANGAHCINPDCLMHYAFETGVTGGSMSGPIPTPDADCIADLKANGGK